MDMNEFLLMGLVVGTLAAVVGGLAALWFSVCDGVPEDARLYTLLLAVGFNASLAATIYLAWRGLLV